jgi:hypothetical protein
MHIINVSTRQHKKDFLNVPREIYKHDPYWISHLDKDIEDVFDPARNKFFGFGEAARWVLFDEQHRLIGRIAAFINRQVAFTYKHPVGGCGFFECTDDQQAANQLFSTAQEWLQQRGMQAMDGPINFGERDRFWGLLVEGFNNPTPYLLNYNPSYYIKLFENYGFRNFFDQYVYKMDRGMELHPVFKRNYERLMHDHLFRFESLKVSQLDKYATDFMTIFNEAWSDVQKHFKPITREQALSMFESMKAIIDPDLIVFAYHDQRPVAIFVGMPELNQLFRYVNGKLNLWGKMKFLFYRFMGKCDTAYGIVFGTVPEFRHRGVESGLIMNIHETVMTKNRYRHMYLAWIGHYNPKMIKIVETLTTQKVFVLTTYRKMFSEEYEFERHYIIE